MTVNDSFARWSEATAFSSDLRKDSGGRPNASIFRVGDFTGASHISTKAVAEIKLLVAKPGSTTEPPSQVPRPRNPGRRPTRWRRRRPTPAVSSG